MDATQMIGTSDPVYRAHMQCRLYDAGVPAHLHDGFLGYLLQRRPVGSFLQACLENNLRQAVQRADPVSRDGLLAIVDFLMLYVPAEAWGSPAAVDAWLCDAAPVPVTFE